MNAAPIVGKVATFIETAIPIVSNAYDKVMEFWKSLAPYKPHLLFPAAAGFVMCFFGGSFLTVIAAFEAYQMCGYDTTVQCLKDLHEDFTKMVETNKKDDVVDDDNDGVADVLQITPQALLQRKLLLALKSVDPKRLSAALAGLNASFLGLLCFLVDFVLTTHSLCFSCGCYFETSVRQGNHPRKCDRTRSGSSGETLRTSYVPVLVACGIQKMGRTGHRVRCTQFRDIARVDGTASPFCIPQCCSRWIDVWSQHHRIS